MTRCQKGTGALLAQCVTSQFHARESTGIDAFDPPVPAGGFSFVVVQVRARQVRGSIVNPYSTIADGK